jgi:ribosome biogenesis GTPase
VGLEALGFRARHAESLAALGDASLLGARVLAVFQHIYRVGTETGEHLAEVSGRLRHRATGPEALPAVGDFVALRLSPHGGHAVIQAVLPRDGAFVRKAAGETSEQQVVAANVDTVLILMGADGDFNLRRLERYLALAAASHARPVVLLTKIDVAQDPEALVAQAQVVAGQTPVLPISAPRGDGLPELLPYFQPGSTLALLGSSGVGKSTLVNVLLGEATQRTREVRQSDHRGRHTTTNRELFILPSGALVIDSPGMRELQVMDSAADLKAAFGDIGLLAQQCRFGDCSHTREPGCAVVGAVEAGTLESSRYDNWLKLTREVQANASRLDPAAQRAQKQRDKAATRALSKHLKTKR